MYSASSLEFVTAGPASPDVTIDESTNGKQELLTRLAEGLAFPDYFGENWDALIDCLSDLSWCRASGVTIDHASLPRLSSGDLRLYLESLIDAAERRSPERLPRLRLVFRLKDRESIIAALAGAGSTPVH